MATEKISKILLHSPGAKKNKNSGIYLRFASAKKLLEDNNFEVLDNLNIRNTLESSLIITDSMVAYILLFMHKKCYFQMHDLREFENINYSRYRYKRIMLFTKKLFFSFARVVTISQFSNNELLKYFKKEAKAILPNFIYDAPSPNKFTHIGDKKLLIYNDSLPHKNPKVITNLLKDMENLESISATTKIKEAGYIIVPSIYEGFGYVPLQFALYGLKPIISDIPPHKETYNDIAVVCNDFSKDNIYKIVEESFAEKPIEIANKAMKLNGRLKKAYLKGIRKLIDEKY